MSRAKDSSIRNLESIRHALLSLHKALLDSERIEYERVNGRIRTSGEFLKLVTQDSFFSWLHPLSDLVVQIDMRFDDEEPMTEASVSNLIRQARLLLKPGKVVTPFSKKLAAAIQRSPEVVIAFSETSGLLVSATIH